MTEVKNRIRAFGFPRMIILAFLALLIVMMFILNVPLGMVIGATLDAIRITSPRLIKKLVNKLGDSAVSIVGDAIIDKLNAILGKRVVLKDEVDEINDSNTPIDKN